MKSSLRRWLAAPVFPADERKTRRAELLNTALLVLIGAWAVIIVGEIVGGHLPPLIVQLNGVLLVLFFGLRAGLRRGAVMPVGITLLAGAYAVSTLSLAIIGTVRAPTAGAYIVLVLLAGILFEKRGLLAACGLGSLALLGLIVAEAAGWLPTPDYTVTVAQWVTSTALIILSAILLNDSLLSVRQALQRAAAELAGRQQAEAALRESETRLRQVLESTPEIVLTVDHNHQVTMANPACVQAQAAAREKTVILEGPEQVSHTREAVAEAWHRAFAWALSGDRFNLAARLGDGAAVQFFETTFTPLRDSAGAIVGALMMGRDVTARRGAEQALRDSERYYRLLFEDNPQPMFVFDLDSLAFLAVNAAAIQHYGYSQSEFLAMTVRDVLLPEAVPAWRRVLGEAAPRHFQAGLWRHRRRDGSLIDVEVTTSEMPFAGRPAQLAVVTDVTEHQRVEAALRESEARLRQVLESVSEGIFAVDGQYRLLIGNTSFHKLRAAAGLPPLAAGASALGADGPADLNTAWRAAYDRALRGESFAQEFRSAGPDGAVAIFENSFTPLRDAAGAGIGALVVTHDVTTRRSGG